MICSKCGVEVEWRVEPSLLMACWCQTRESLDASGAPRQCSGGHEIEPIPPLDDPVVVETWLAS